MNRSTASYLYLTAVAAVVLWIAHVTVSNGSLQSDDVLTVCYLTIAAVTLNRTSVRLDRGRLTLIALPMGAAAILLNPIHAATVGLAGSIGSRGRGTWPLVANSVIYAALGAVGAWESSLLPGGSMAFLDRVLVLLTVNGANLALVTTGLFLHTGESMTSIARHNFAPSFFVAFAYLILAALLVSYVLDGSALGYLLATIVFVLALALTDTIAGRRIRRVLESELSDADRHLFHSRAVEGVVHNLRNHIASAVGYLKEIDLNRLDPVDREAVETATAAANDAVTVLRTLSQGATPRVSYSPAPVDLNEVVVRALGMARPRARSKEIELGLREAPDEVKVRADPLLLREVLTNLINNAIDAAPKNGRVDLITGRRSNGWPYVSVADNGPGVSEDNRHHLFEPHFTTKESGTGLGLFMSYGIIREHQGQLLFEGSRHGAVFTVVLPPIGADR